jgi:hypothetical protein
MIQVVQYTCTSTRVFLEPEISKCLCMYVVCTHTGDFRYSVPGTLFFYIIIIH